MTSLNVLYSRLINSPASRRAGTGYFKLYRAWKIWALKRQDGPAHFAGVKAVSADVVSGYYPSARRRRCR